MIKNDHMVMQKKTRCMLSVKLRQWRIHEGGGGGGGGGGGAALGARALPTPTPPPLSPPKNCMPLRPAMAYRLQLSKLKFYGVLTHIHLSCRR